MEVLDTNLHNLDHQAPHQIHQAVALVADAKMIAALVVDIVVRDNVTGAPEIHRQQHLLDVAYQIAEVYAKRTAEFNVLTDVLVVILDVLADVKRAAIHVVHHVVAVVHLAAHLKVVEQIITHLHVTAMDVHLTVQSYAQLFVKQVLKVIVKVVANRVRAQYHRQHTYVNKKFLEPVMGSKNFSPNDIILNFTQYCGGDR